MQYISCANSSFVKILMFEVTENNKLKKVYFILLVKTDSNNRRYN